MAKVPNPDPASETLEAGSSASGDGFDRMLARAARFTAELRREADRLDRVMADLRRKMAERERQVVAS